MDTKTHYSQQIGDVYFNLVKITNKAQKEEWSNYVDKAAYTYGGDGILTFQTCLGFYNNTGTDVWVAYVSNEPLINPSQINKSGIEMYMSVTTSEHAIFTTHMGIQRVPCEKPHKNISVTLHEFCAKTMHEYYPDKTFMLNTPQQLMRDMLLSAMEARGKGDAVYI